MKPVSHLFPCFYFFFFFAVFLPVVSPSASTFPVNIWPKPTTISWPSPAASPLSPSFTILSSHPSHPHLSAAISRYQNLLLSERHRPLVPPSLPSCSVPLSSLSLSISNPSAPLHHAADESHSLSVSLTGLATLAAATPWGAIRGLESFSQLVWASESRLLVAAGINITDRPLFPHRGLLLDTSRNFIPVEDILRTVRAMGYNKMNVLHWHITDSQSFPILLPSVPELAVKGSYGPEMQYSPEDVRRIVGYAMSYGVRVMPEIDAPGHTGSWAEAYPEIVTCANKFWAPAGKPALAADPGTGQLNPLIPETYDVVRAVFRDIAELFPEPFFHGGADEVNTACWEDDGSIAAFISGGGTHDELLRTFISKTHPFITADLNRTAVYWEDVVLGPAVKVPPSTIPKESAVMQTWNNGPNNTKILAGMGYRVIVSSWDFYYLDCGYGGWYGNDSQYDSLTPGGDGGSWCSPFKTWQRVYDYDITEGLTEEEAALVVGGEVAMWTAQVDGVVLDGRVWPRASAMAESMWSGNRGHDGKKRYAEATDRLNEWRRRMVGRGIAAEPIQPLWCAKHPSLCNFVE
ncbi:Beta-hexosaminidase 2 [Platanthera zijinensis]|uniref:Beta-hexosaminidase n=1 Tax=Platanthera zijinensis TaxID=2320716 RepID=A0AAP0B8U5_9ASPA